METNRITAYTKWEDMAVYYSNVVEGLPKVAKFTIGESLLNSLLEEGSCLQLASVCKGKQKLLALLDKADGSNARLVVGARILCRRKLIDEHKYGILAQFLTETGKLIGAFIKKALGAV